MPRILIISLKRFKQNKANRYSAYGYGNKKLETFVDFPLEGLDMAPFVLSKSQKEEMPLIYDLFAVSNHFGGVGGGHYTAYARNYTTGKWYDFDDSSCTEITADSRRSSIVSSAAYSLFYRLRGHTDLANINFDKLKQEPDDAFLE